MCRYCRRSRPLRLLERDSETDGYVCRDEGTMILTADIYRTIRARLAALGYGDDYTWAQSVEEPQTPEVLVREYTWVVINSGMKNTIARKIMDRVWPRILGGLPPHPEYGHVAKALAIWTIWNQRESRFLQFLEANSRSTSDVLDWCESLPWIGKITKYHLAKNLGVDVAKPDRWLARLAVAEATTVDELCARLARETGDRIATVDVVLWRACAIGVLRIEDGKIRVSEAD